MGVWPQDNVPLMRCHNVQWYQYVIPDEIVHTNKCHRQALLKLLVNKTLNPFLLEGEYIIFEHFESKATIRYDTVNKFYTGNWLTITISGIHYITNVKCIMAPVKSVLSKIHL